MKTIEEIKERLTEHKEGLKERFKVKELGIFGKKKFTWPCGNRTGAV